MLKKVGRVDGFSKVAFEKEIMGFWPKSENIEGRGEIYLQWKNLFIIALIMLFPLIIALFLQSLVFKIICYGISLLAYISYLRFQGPCVTALAVGAIPWYIYFEWESSPWWLFIIAIFISLLEISYIRNRMAFIKEKRGKEYTID